MEAVKLKQIEEIYHAALEISPTERAAFLSDSCGTDEILLREVESLLAFVNSSNNFLDAPPESLAAEMFSTQDQKTNSLIGNKIDNYKIKKLLGRGGMGEVYLAEDTNLNRQVALKFLSSEVTGNTDRMKRFEREAQTVSGLNHPNILTVHQFGKENENCFIVTEFVKGVTLSEKISLKGLRIGKILDIAIQIAAALATAHQANIIHRDIKPDNIMIRADGLVKILDFGLAKLIEHSENSSVKNFEILTNPGVVMGTVDYMSPEQARGKTVDARTDIFSFGVILFEMLTGQKPFTGETVNHTIINILEKESPSVFDLIADCPVELEQIIRQMMAKNIEERLGTAKELLSQLKKLQKNLNFQDALKTTSNSDLLIKPGTKTIKTDSGDFFFLTSDDLTDISTPIIKREKVVADFSDLLKREYLRLLKMTEAASFGVSAESDFSEAIQITNKINSEFTDNSTNETINAQTETFAPVNITNANISHLNNFSARNIGTKILSISLVVLVLAVAGFFGYQYFAAKSRIESIAVMPFVNESRNADFDYLSDGMTDTLINSLSQIPNLSVKARSSVFRYKGKETDLKKIASELNVQAILNGQIAQNGDTLILNLQLVNAETENVIWGKRYEQKISELVLLQNEVARDVSSNLKLKLSGEDAAKVAKNYTADTEAYQLYLKGRFYWNKRNIEDFKRAVKYFNLAIEKDPNYALAYTGLADTYALMPLYGNFRPKEYMPQAKQSAIKALEIDNDLAEAHASLGRILNSYDFDWEGAEREFKKAIELNPNYATVHQWYAEYLAFKEMPDAALNEISKALELDPFSVAINRTKGNILLFANKYDEAITQLKKTEELYPQNALVKFNIGDVFAAQQMYPEAVNEYITALKLEGLESEKIQNLQNAFKNEGWQGFWQNYLKERLEQRETLLEKDKSAYINNEQIAYVYAAVKDKEKSLEYLNRAFEERDPDLITIKMSDVYDFLSDEPQFKGLIKNVGLPE